MDYDDFYKKKQVVLHAEHESEEATEELFTDQAPDDTEEAEDPRHFIEPFSLLSNLVRENFSDPQVPVEKNPVLEVIRYSPEKQVKTYDQVNYRQSYRLGADRRVRLRFSEPLACRLLFTGDVSGGIIAGNRTVALDELKTPVNRVAHQRGQAVYSTLLMKGDYANLLHPGGGSFLRFTCPPALPKVKKSRKLDVQGLKIFGSVFFLHAFFLVVLGLLSPKVQSGTTRDINEFARVSVKDISLPEDEPEVPPAPLPEVTTLTQPVEEKTRPKPKPAVNKPHKPHGTNKHGTGGVRGGGGGGAGMLAALGQLPKKNATHQVATAASNLDAVRVPGGTARFQVSGPVTKLPTTGVIISRGRGVGTKGDIDLLVAGQGRGGSGRGPGHLGGGTAGKGKILGMVMTTPRHKIKTKQGHLDKEKIAEVVKRHTHQIQYCYERSLFKNPKLRGKLLMEWKITLKGTVSIVYTRYNSMHTPAVARCVSRKIKNWRFPKPQGGLVVVEYPFRFESRSF